jgi:hypothetical protein
MTFTITNDQAINFYEDMVDQVNNYGLSILEDREDRLMFKKGRTLVEDLINQVSKKTGREYVLYNNVEREFIAVNYHNGMNRPQIIEAFYTEFGTHHSEGSIGQKVEMCRMAEGLQEFTFRDIELAKILKELDSNRYRFC